MLQSCKFDVWLLISEAIIDFKKKTWHNFGHLLTSYCKRKRKSLPIFWRRKKTLICEKMAIFCSMFVALLREHDERWWWRWRRERLISGERNIEWHQKVRCLFFEKNFYTFPILMRILNKSYFLTPFFFNLLWDYFCFWCFFVYNLFVFVVSFSCKLFSLFLSPFLGKHYIRQVKCLFIYFYCFYHHRHPFKLA